MRTILRFIFAVAFALPALTPGSLASVPSSTTWIQATITALPQVVPVTFVFQSTSDVLVLDSKSSPPVTLVSGSDYTITGGLGSTGSITVRAGGTNAVAVGDRITVTRRVPLTQTTAFSPGGPVTPAMLGSAFDKLTMISQQLNLTGGNSLRFQQDEQINGTMPLTQRKNAFLAFDANGVPWFPTAASIVPSSITPLSAQNIAALGAVPVTSLPNNSPCTVLGYATPGDGGGGIFYYNSGSSATANGATIVTAAGGVGRWFRLYEGVLNVRWWGATGAGAVDDAPAIQAAVTYALTINDGVTVYTPPGNYLLGSTITLDNAGTQKINFIGAGGHSTRFFIDSLTFVPTSSRVLNFTVANPRCEFGGFTVETVNGQSQTLVYINGNGCRIYDIWAGGGITGFELPLTDSDVSMCFSENNQTGFLLRGYDMSVSQCGTYRNWYSGFHVVGTTDPAAPINSVMTLQGCHSEQDGHALLPTDPGVSAGFYVNSDFGVIMTGCQMSNIHADNNNDMRYGVHIAKGRNVVINSSTIRGPYKGGIFVEKCTDLAIGKVIIDNVNVTGVTVADKAGIVLRPALAFDIQRVTIDGVNISNTRGPAMVLASTITCKVTGGSLYNCSTSNTAATGLASQAFIIITRGSATETYDVSEIAMASQSIIPVGVYLAGTAGDTKYQTMLTNLQMAKFTATAPFQTTFSAAQILAHAFLRNIGDKFNPILTSIAAAPEFVGQQAVVSGVIYFAKDVTGTGDWVKMRQPRTGTAVLVAGTVTVADTETQAGTLVYTSVQIVGGTPGVLQSIAVSPGVSFTITSTNAADTSTVQYLAMDPL